MSNHEEQRRTSDRPPATPGKGLDGLIEALLIFREYTNRDSPTICMNDQLIIAGLKPSGVSPDDVTRLDALGFIIGSEMGDEYFFSFRYGS